MLDFRFVHSYNIVRLRVTQLRGRRNSGYLHIFLLNGFDKMSAERLFMLFMCESETMGLACGVSTTPRREKGRDQPIRTKSA